MFVLKRFAALIAAAAILFSVACQPIGPLPDTGASPTPPVDTSLENTAWRLESFGAAGAEEPVLPGSTITLMLEENGQAGGSGGCNSFGASYQARDGTITFSDLVSTLMACLDEGVDEQEQRYFQALQAAGRYELSDDRLVISSEDGQNVLNFVPAGAPVTNTPAANLLCSSPAEPLDPNWKLCRSEVYGFEVQYPQDGNLIDQTATTARITLPFTPGTNLTEKYLDINVAENQETCSTPLAEGHAPGTIPAEPVQLNGVEFIKETGAEGAAGNIFNWVAYSTSREDLCVSLSFVLRSHPPELEPTPPPEYDPAAESAIFEEIAATFRWLGPEPTAGPTTPATSTPEVVPTVVPTVIPTIVPTVIPTFPPVQPTPSPKRINFETGATSASVTGSLPASGSDLYVLAAQGGQTMTVDLSFTQGRAILAVWGEDGTVLLSDHAEASRFSGTLPSTQDYFILLKGRPDGETDYRMTVTIPPLP